jgi:hypothetical protein
VVNGAFSEASSVPPAGLNEAAFTCVLGGNAVCASAGVAAPTIARTASAKPIRRDRVDRSIR